MARSLPLALLLLAALPAVAAAAGPEWQPPIQLASDQAYDPKVAASESGVAVGWTEVVDDLCPDGNGNSYPCHVARVAVSRTGRSFRPAATVTPDGTQVASSAELAVTPGGEVIAAWARGHSDPEKATNVLEVAVAGMENGRFGRPQKVPTRGTPFHPLTLVTNARGVTALAWIESDYGAPGWRIKVALRPARGRFGRPVTVAESTGVLRDYAVTLADDGRVLVLWGTLSDDGESLLYARVRSATGDLGEPELVQAVEASGGSGPSVADPEAAWSEAGERVLAWSILAHTCGWCERETVFTTWASPSGSFAAPQQLTPDDESNQALRLAVNSRGGALLAWERSSPARAHDDMPPGYGRATAAAAFSDIRLSKRTPSGAFGMPISLGKNATDPLLAVLGLDAFLAWKEWTGEGESYALVGAFHPAHADRRVVRTIVDNGSQIEQPVIAAHPYRGIVLVWREGGPPWRIMVTQGPADSAPPRIDRLSASRLVSGRQALTVAFRLSERAEVELRLRGGRGELTRTVFRRAGKRRVGVSARRLGEIPPGRYRARLHATDIAGQSSRTRAIRIRVAR